MEGAIFGCPAGWTALLPPGLRRVGRAEDLAERVWDLLVLTAAGCGALGRASAACRILLAPGDCAPEAVLAVEAETVISYGLSSRDSLTLSSLAEPVLCVQRTLPRPGGGEVEPQEIPLPDLPGPAEELLAVLGARLLADPRSVLAPGGKRRKSADGGLTNPGNGI